MTRWCFSLLLVCSLQTLSLGQEPSKKTTATDPKSKIAPATKLSDAERISRLQTTLAADQKLRDFLKTKLDLVAEDIKKSSREFSEMDQQVNDKTKELERLQAAKKEAEAKKLGTELTDFRKRWELSKERLNLIVQERKTLQERVTSLDDKILLNRQELDRLSGAGATKAGPETVKPPPGEVPPTKGPEPAVKAPEIPRELQQARLEAKEKEAAALEAEREAESIAERCRSLQKNIELQQKLLETARKKADLANASQSELRQELANKAKAGAPQAAIQDVERKIAEADRQADEARKEVRERTDSLGRMQGELTILNQEQILAMQEAERKQQDVVQAKQNVGKLENPFAPGNMLRWLALHGPKILFILLGMVGSVLFLRIVDQRLIALLVQQSSQKSLEERENRAKTLVGVFHSAAWLVIFISGGLMILDETGIPIVPLMGGAAVLGLAVAFGAQNLIKDYFFGFVILIENQYGINDVVRIGALTGLVEQITLRLTMLRDLDGSVHFIPHGQVTTVTNMTHQWSRALFDIGVAYQENVDHVMTVLLNLGKEMRQDPRYAGWILDDPEMLGVDALGDSAVTIRFYLKTRPMKQWTVKRELTRRIKNKFDELGIVIPFPQHTVHVHAENGTLRRQSLENRSEEAERVN